jgi:hypothetical protein
MRKIFSVLFVSLLATTSVASDLAKSFKEAVALADTEDEDRATRIYAKVDLTDYYQRKYMPVFQSCLKSTENPDTSTFSFVIAIGKDGRVLRFYTDHETNILACVRPTLLKDEFPQPPTAPYYMHMTMNFSK